MRYNRFGRTGLIVSELCLGTMTFGETEGRFKAIAGLGQDAANALVKAAVDAGINFIDTANVYAEGLSETMTGQAIRDLGLHRDEIVVATKAMGAMASGSEQGGTGRGRNGAGTSRYHLLAQVDHSLKRLGLDHVDLYQIHGWDPLTPIDETLRALEDIVRSGRARYIGVSNWAAWQIAKANGISERHGWSRFESVQAYYTIAGRDLEREIVPMLTAEGMGLMVWSPLAGGLLSGKYTRDGGEGRRANFDFPPIDKRHAFDIVDAMRPLADARGVSVAQIAIAWLLHQRVVTSVIVGAKRPDQLADNIAACDVELSADDLATLDKAGALDPQYPQWMFAVQGAYRRDVASPRR